MKKFNLEIIIFIINAIYMILELIASRILSPYFGSSNLIWTSVIGIILLSTSVGNYIGGIIADKKDSKTSIKIVIAVIGILIMLIPIMQQNVLATIVNLINDLKVGAIISTLIIFFIPSMFIGILSPIIIKLKMENLNNVGKVSGKIYAIATLGSIVGTFLGGFYLIPNYGSNEILFVLAIITFFLLLLIDNENIIKKSKKILGFIITGTLICTINFYSYSYENEINGKKVLNGELNTFVSYDTEYGRVLIKNAKRGEDICRYMLIDKGNESATYIDENKRYNLIFAYTKYYDLMFNSNKDIKDVLMIGGAGYSYPKYFISNYLDKNMDVVEIDSKVTEIAKKYFYLDKLIKEFDSEKDNRLNLIENDGRVYLNKNKKKYDAILNDAFSGENPAKTLTTLEAVEKIYNSLTEKGIYLTNIISSIEGENSKFIKAEVHTLKQVFKNVYIIPCSDTEELYRAQNNMVIATDDELKFNNDVNVDISDTIILTDNYCPVDSLIPKK